VRAAEIDPHLVAPKSLERPIRINGGHLRCAGEGAATAPVGRAEDHPVDWRAAQCAMARRNFARTASGVTGNWITPKAPGAGA